MNYSIFSLTPDGEELVLAANEMEYDTMPHLMDVDVSAIRAFEDEVNALLKDAFVLVDNTNNGIAQYSTAENKIVNQCSGYADYVERMQKQQESWEEKVNVMVNVHGVAGISRVVQQSASDQIRRLAAQAGSEVAVIEAIEEIPTGSVGLWSGNYIYRVNYTLPDREQSYFYLCTHEEWPWDDGRITEEKWYFLGYLTEEELQNRYNTAEMREKYGSNEYDLYLAAVCEMYQNWAAANDCLCEQAASWE